MKHYTSQLKISTEWRKLLVVESDVPIDTSVTEIEFPIDETSSVKYFTHGLHKTVLRDGKYFYWLLYDETQLTGELADLQQANNILMGGSE